MQVIEVVILGAGPAGLATALQLKRQGNEALLLEGERMGGLLHNANLVENYLGFPGGLPGPQLITLFLRQAQQIGIEPKLEKVISLTYEDQNFRVETSTNLYLARIVVVATGTRPKTFNASLIPEGLKSRVFYEVYPLLGVKGKRIAIVGAGDAAFDYALNLAEENEILILNRGEDISSLSLLWERAQKLDTIQYFKETQILAFEDAPQGRIRLVCESLEGEIAFEVDDIIGAIGREPRLDFMAANLSEQVNQLEADSLLHFIGDVKNGRYRQTAIAVGDGIKAAMQINQRLSELSMEHTI